MTMFGEIMDTMNEKKYLLIRTYPDKEIEVMKGLSFTPYMGLGQLVIEKRVGYNIVKIGEQADTKGRGKMGTSTSVLSKRPRLEERPLELAPKSRRLKEIILF